MLIINLIIGTFFIYYFTNLEPQHYYDYTFRVAENFLNGKIGFTHEQPTWLNEFVPYNGNWYSVFPLGSILTMLPFAALKIFGLINDMPAVSISALTTAFICLFLFKITDKYEHKFGKKILLTMAILFGTWMWVNQTMGGAWQLALGFAMLGELGAIYFSVYEKKPFLAGVFFALAFGNRTEILLTAPIFMFLLLYNLKPNNQSAKSDIKNVKFEILKLRSEIFLNPRLPIRKIVKFCAIPFVLGVSTLIYNYLRFDSFVDFGYSRIPGVLEEPWYKHGIFSLYYIPRQAYEMLFKSWETRAVFPYLLPDKFSSSILWSSPFLLLTLRFGAKDKVLKYAAWIAIFILTILLWMHGNSGGYQFGYRYAMVLLPWIFVILLENSPKKITLLEWAFYGLSFAINIFAVYLFHWSGYLKMY